jgi:hypothetical protein
MDGQVRPPTAVDGTEGKATAIAAGAFHSLAIAAPEADFHVLALGSLGTLALLAHLVRRP